MEEERGRRRLPPQVAADMAEDRGLVRYFSLDVVLSTFYAFIDTSLQLADTVEAVPWAVTVVAVVPEAMEHPMQVSAWFNPWT
jgi:hypothetical protein